MAEPGGNKRRWPLPQAPALLGRVLGSRPHWAAAFLPCPEISRTNRKERNLLPWQIWASKWARLGTTAACAAVVCLGKPAGKSEIHHRTPTSNPQLITGVIYIYWRYVFTLKKLILPGQVSCGVVISEEAHSYTCICRIRALLNHVLICI